jgi:hypothetical protein
LVFFPVGLFPDHTNDARHFSPHLPTWHQTALQV